MHNMILVNALIGVFAILWGTKYVFSWRIQTKSGYAKIKSDRNDISKKKFLTNEEIFEHNFNMVRGTILIVVGAVAFFLGLR
ncbi:MAG: hypothetical protein KKD39_04250 [Candidatus Altiarchaeota archaeon]|nr:hypothetical protein [Candidatus Altiarchaeota archaeon]